MNHSPDSKPLEILLVDDNPTDVLLTREALSCCALLHLLDTVDDGEKALQYLRQLAPYGSARHPGLVLLDLNLPRKSGLETLREIKSDPLLRSIPVVVLTTSKAREDIASAYDLHANCCVTKPVDFGTFSEVIRTIEMFWGGVVTLPPGGNS